MKLKASNKEKGNHMLTDAESESKVTREPKLKHRYSPIGSALKIKVRSPQRVKEKPYIV
jgi:hypothetical protein